MANYSIKLDLMKLRNSFVETTKDREGKEVKCLVIPIEDSDLYLGEKGCYLNLTAYETKASKYGETHFVKQNFSKEFSRRASQEYLKNRPFFGNLIEEKPKYQSNYEKNQSQPQYTPKNDTIDNLPW